jgi:hypothetical protein
MTQTPSVPLLTQFLQRFICDYFFLILTPLSVLLARIRGVLSAPMLRIRGGMGYALRKGLLII